MEKLLWGILKFLLEGPGVVTGAQPIKNQDSGFLFWKTSSQVSDRFEHSRTSFPLEKTARLAKLLISQANFSLTGFELDVRHKGA